MSKAAVTAFAQRLADEVTTLVTCWKITRRDGAVLGFTDHVRGLGVDGITYRAASGYTRMAIQAQPTSRSCQCYEFGHVENYKNCDDAQALKATYLSK